MKSNLVVQDDYCFCICGGEGGGDIIKFHFQDHSGHKIAEDTLFVEIFQIYLGSEMLMVEVIRDQKLIQNVLIVATSNQSFPLSNEKKRIS